MQPRLNTFRLSKASQSSTKTLAIRSCTLTPTMTCTPIQQVNLPWAQTLLRTAQRYRRRASWRPEREACCRMLLTLKRRRSYGRSLRRWKNTIRPHQKDKVKKNLRWWGALTASVKCQLTSLPSVSRTRVQLWWTWGVVRTPVASRVLSSSRHWARRTPQGAASRAWTNKRRPRAESYRPSGYSRFVADVLSRLHNQKETLT